MRVSVCRVQFHFMFSARVTHTRQLSTLRLRARMLRLASPHCVSTHSACMTSCHISMLLNSNASSALNFACSTRVALSMMPIGVSAPVVWGAMRAPCGRTRLTHLKPKYEVGCRVDREEGPRLSSGGLYAGCRSPQHVVLPCDNRKCVRDPQPPSVRGRECEKCRWERTEEGALRGEREGLPCVLVHLDDRLGLHRERRGCTPSRVLRSGALARVRGDVQFLPQLDPREEEALQ